MAGFAFRAHNALWRALCAITVGLVLAATTPIPAGGHVGQTSAILRFDQAVYAAGSCAGLTLDAPRLAGMGDRLPPIEVAVVREKQRVGSVTVRVREEMRH